MKNNAAYYKNGSVLVNLIEGIIAVIAFAMVYAFLLVPDNQDHSVVLGLAVLFVWLLFMLIPNIFFCSGGKFTVKDSLCFQLVPFMGGALMYIVFQLFLY